jgi:hypothetical protein
LSFPGSFHDFAAFLFLRFGPFLSPNFLLNLACSSLLEAASGCGNTS